MVVSNKEHSRINKHMIHHKLLVFLFNFILGIIVF